MTETTLKIAMAAFMHDMGKFAGVKELGISPRDIDEYDRQLYLPSDKGQYSHSHAVYTSEFIKRFQAYLPPELTRREWGEGDIFTNLAAGHHKPETPMQWTIAVADRLSSGWDRDKFEKEYNQSVSWKDYKKTRLLPVLEQLKFGKQNTKDSIDDYKYRYSLSPITPDQIFPGLINTTVPGDRDAAEAEYRELFEGFSNCLKKLSHRAECISLWFEHFESLMMVYASHIPAARAGNVVPDVSLYDHSRITAALAAAIYLYHSQNGTLTEAAVNAYGDEKFLMINGDFQGIQDFIFSRFSESKKFRSKILRGRSFAVSLMSELSADMLCREIGLPFTSIILNAAGKFTIIAPNTEQSFSAVQKVENIINDWLVKSSYGETLINISTQRASCSDFTSGNFSKLWDRIRLKMEEKKCTGINMNLYGGVVEGYLDSFVNEPGKSPICHLCGKRPSIKTTGFSLGEDHSACALCRDHVFLGTGIVKKNRLVITTADSGTARKEDCLLEPIFGVYQVSFDETGTDDLAVRGKLLKYWNLGTRPEDILESSSAVKFISAYVPRYSTDDENDDRLLSTRKSESNVLDVIDQVVVGDPKTLNHIACTAKTGTPGKYRGIEALGVLKADIDHLGLLMACGLQENRFTLSRLATLSRQLNYYFAVYLPNFLAKEMRFRNTYTVFAGGDDLFLIGPWNSIVDLSQVLSESFADYVCRNDDIHFSAGIVLHKPHTPVDSMAETAEAALEKSKSEGRNRLTLFSETSSWNEIGILSGIEQELEKWLDLGWISHVMFYKLNDFIKMVSMEKQVISENEIHLIDMACTKWRAMLVYAAERNIASRIKGDERKKIVREVTEKLTEWLDLHGSKLKIPVWKILYNRR